MGDSGRRAAEPQIDRLLERMTTEGVPLGPDAILEAVEHPGWEATRHARDWRTYVPQSMRLEWAMLPLVARLCVFETAELAALEEDAGASMVTRSG
jgi:hypothetical protein